MNLSRFALDNRVFVLTLVAGLAAFGAYTFDRMPRREDPEILIRTCLVLTRWPGASARKVEDLVTDPIETAINEIDGVDEIRSESRTGYSVVYVDLDERIKDVDQYWDEVRAKVDRVSAKLPPGCQAPFVNSDFGDVAAVVLALFQTPPPGDGEITRPYSWRELEVLGESIQDELKSVDSVARVDLIGVQDEVIYLEVDSADWAKIALDADDLKDLLEARNIVSAGGEIDTDVARFTVTPTGEFGDPGEIEGVLVGGGEGAVPRRLGDLPITVRRGVVEPSQSRVRLTTPEQRAERCLLLAVAMKSGSNIVEMGSEIDQRVRRLMERRLPPDIELVRINDLPRQVDNLVSDFVTNLWQSILIVLLVALVMMGWRPALIMAAAIPLCMIAAIAVARQFGVELEQFSIASLIIALGMLVDNAIVVADNVMVELRKGTERSRAAIRGAWDLAVPILTSTATTVAAFLPMLTVVGSVGEYTRSLPIVVAVTLIISYLVAMTVTPLMCFWLLKPPRTSGESRPPVSKRSGVYDRSIRWCLAHRRTTIAAASAAVLASLALVPSIGSQFFPGGVRDQLFIHVWLPEGSSLEATGRVCEAVEAALRETSPVGEGGDRRERLRYATTLLGTGGPRLNLTSSPEQTFPNYAHILVNTTDPTLSAEWAAEIKARTDLIPGALIDVRSFTLGPYIKNPVELRLIGDDHDLLRERAEEMIQAFRATPGTVNPTSNWRNDGYQVDVEVDAQAANLAGVANIDVAESLQALLSGTRLTTFREGDHTIDVVLRMREEERHDVLSSLRDIHVSGSAGKVPLGSIAQVGAGWAPAVIARRDTRRCVTVGAQVESGVLPNAAVGRVKERLAGMVAALPPGYRVEVGGELEQTAESQAKLVRAFSLSGLLILLVLVAQYNSLAKPLIVLSTVPLALIGALLGLFGSGWALGFMPSLGIISLAGVVINNAIILIDFIEANVRDGASLHDAIASAGSQRMKPIVLTTLTTIGGMLPLALFGGPMWAGMSWAMVGGLALSTALTLLVVPTIYAAMASTWKMRVA